MNAAWWREYRRTHREAIAATNRRRRQNPDVRRARHRQEVARRKRRRAEDTDVPLTHPLLDQAAQLVPSANPGGALRFPRELLVEDCRSEAVLALLEDRDPRVAVARYRVREQDWLARTCSFIGSCS